MSEIDFRLPCVVQSKMTQRIFPAKQYQTTSTAISTISARTLSRNILHRAVEHLDGAAWLQIAVRGSYTDELLELLIQDESCIHGCVST